MLLELNNHIHIYNQIIVIVSYILYTVLSLLNVIVLLNLTIWSNHCEKVCTVCKLVIYFVSFYSHPHSMRESRIPTTTPFYR